MNTYWIPSNDFVQRGNCIYREVSESEYRVWCDENGVDPDDFDVVEF